MTSNRSLLPSAADITAFFFSSCGLSKGKSGDQGYKRIERLLKQTKQSGTISEEVEAALFNEICALFTGAPELRASDLVAKAQESHTRRILAFRHAFGVEEPRDFGHCLLYLLGEFLLRNEWFCQQQEAENRAALPWKWVDWANVFYAHTLCDFTSYGGGLRHSLPWNPSWNLPTRDADGSVAWPISHALDWWEDLLGQPLRGSELRAHELVSAKTLGRYRTGKSMPTLQTIELWSKHAWSYRGAFKTTHQSNVRQRWQDWLVFAKRKKFTATSLYAAIGPMSGVEPGQWLTTADPFIEELPVLEFLDRVQARYTAPSERRLRAVFLWCRALQTAYSAVAKRHSPDAVFRLADWARQCCEAHARFEVFQREYAARDSIAP
jgi:hypothetical protein